LLYYLSYACGTELHLGAMGIDSHRLWAILTIAKQPRSHVAVGIWVAPYFPTLLAYLLSLRVIIPHAKSRDPVYCRVIIQHSPIPFIVELSFNTLQSRLLQPSYRSPLAAIPFWVIDPDFRWWP
jgi:hypothetical protein